MIKLERLRDQSHIHSDFTGARLSAKLIKLVAARISDGQEMEFEGAIGDWKKTKDTLKLESHGKCAYCESDTETVAHGDVEHFRPKSIYWWLALCLDNYTYSCQLCNQTYKSDEFPVTGSRLKGPRLPKKLPATQKAINNLIQKISPDPATISDAELIKEWFNEKADLPNPYLEDPETLLAWAVSEINEEVHVVIPPNASDRSKRAVRAAIECLGLNRETLVRSRYVFYENLVFALEVWRTGAASAKSRAEVKIRRMTESKVPYAGMSRYFARQNGFAL